MTNASPKAACLGTEQLSPDAQPSSSAHASRPCVLGQRSPVPMLSRMETEQVEEERLSLNTN